MVCKEEIFLWFKSLKGSRRLEVLCGLLNMCCPLELRFCATCVEELASRDFYSLKDEESKANNTNEVSKIRNILDPHMRSKLIVSLSLLHSSNVLCSNVLFKTLVEEIKVEGLVSAGVISDSKCVDEILLLLTMAQNHPAFTFEQQTYLTELCSAVESYAQQTTNEEENGSSDLNNLLPTVNLLSPVLIPDSHVCSNASVFYHHRDYDSHTGQRIVDSTSSQAQITSLKVKAPHKKVSFRIRVAFGTNKVFDVFKTPHEIAVFHQKLVQLFPHESHSSNHEKYIPQLPHAIATSSKQEVLNENLTASLTEYIQQLNCHLPSHIMQNDFVVNFFLPSGHGRTSLSKGGRNSEAFLPDESKNPRLRSLTIYNSHISECSPTKRTDSRTRMVPQSPSAQQMLKKVSENGANISESPVVPQSSPLISPLTSPYVSPTNSETNSRSASPWVQRIIADHTAGVLVSESYALEKLLIKEHLHEYWESLRHYRLDELQAMPQEEFEGLGIKKEASAKIRKILDNLRSFAPPNGLNQVISRNSVAAVPSSCLPIRDVSNESSPVCSEYSSPSQSPSPTEICNHHSPNSSSSEETAMDKGPFKTADEKVGETVDRGLQEVLSKRFDESLVFPKNIRECGRQSVSSVVPFPVGYATAVPQLSPMPGHKPSFLPMQCRTNAGLHLSPGGVVFDSQFSRVPLPSALTFLPHMSTQRSHTGSLERGLSSTAGLPITTLCPFPVVTSGCNTVPSATCSFASNKSGNITVVTNSVASGNGQSRQFHKVVQPSHDAEILPKPPLHQQTIENLYAPNCGYLFSSGDVSARANVASSCSCICTASVARPSPAPSPSLPPASTPQQAAVPVSLPYIGLPYVFPHSFPFIQTHTGAPANGFMQPATIPAAAGHGFTYALPNGMSAITPEILYGAHAFTPQSPSPSQATPPLIASPVSQCYSSYPQPATIAGMTATHAVKVATCYNCGKIGHRGSECKEQNIEDISKPGKFQMNFAAAAKPLESHD